MCITGVLESVPKVIGQESRNTLQTGCQPITGRTECGMKLDITSPERPELKLKAEPFVNRLMNEYIPF